MTLEEIRLCLSMSSLDFTFSNVAVFPSMSSLDFALSKIVQRSSDYRNIVDPLTKRKRISRDDSRRTDPLTFLTIIKNEG